MMQDPLQVLPAEVVLRILEFVPLSGLTSLARSAKSWHTFVETNQDSLYSQKAHWIYSDNPRSDREELSLGRDFSTFESGNDKSFVQYLKGVDSWKDLCKRLTLLQRNWDSKNPVVRESVIQVGADPVWRFKPDFKRRFIVSTSQSGGVNVTDMNDGRPLWQLSPDDVRVCAHLEYDQESGTACWDRFGNAIEVWKADEVERGAFHRTAVLNHDCETRGFQLSRFKGKESLCVVSSEGQGFVWDLSQHPPVRRTVVEIEQEAVGHLDQSEKLVVYSMGTRGYHVHSKETGELMGKLQPKECSNIYHITHPSALPDLTIATSGHGPTATVCPPQNPRQDRLTPLPLHEGPHPTPASPLDIENDEWGSGIISGDYMAGVSRGGRIFICTDINGSLNDPARVNATTAILHTKGDGSTFEMGGWLSIKNGRVIFEIIDRIYIFTLPAKGQLPVIGPNQRPIWATPTSSAPQLSVPVSFMGIYDDCIMHTYTTLGWRDREASATSTAHTRRPRAFPTKTIRILSLAPDLSAPNGQELAFLPGSEAGSEAGARGRTHAMHSQMLQLVSLLVGDDDESDNEEVEDDEGDARAERENRETEEFWREEEERLRGDDVELDFVSEEEHEGGSET